MVKLILGGLLFFLAVCWLASDSMHQKPPRKAHHFYSLDGDERAERLRSVASEWEKVTGAR